MNLEMRQLEAFAATARTGSFTAAGRELGIGQPAVSQLVRRLEKQLGVVLFQRTGRNVTLTGAASSLLPSVHAALDSFGTVEQSARGLAEGLVGSLRLVSTPGSLVLLRNLLDDFGAIHPQIRIELVPRPAHGRREALRRSEIDFALTRSTPTARGIRYTLAREEPWRVVLASDHPLAGTGSPPTTEDLIGWPFAHIAGGGRSPTLTTYLTAVQDAHSERMRTTKVAALDDLYASLLTDRSWALLTETTVTALVDGVTALPAPAGWGRAGLWLAHRAHPAPLDRSLLTFLANRGSATPSHRAGDDV